MKKERLPSEKVNSENSEIIISEILKFHNLLMQDAIKFVTTNIGLNPPLTHKGAKVFSSFSIQLALFVASIPDIIQVFLQYPDKFQGQLERLLIEIKTIRLDAWFLKTILENTPNLPWDKLRKYLSSHKPIPIDTHIEYQKDLAKFLLKIIVPWSLLRPIGIS